MTQTQKKLFTTRNLTTMAVLAAVASILFLIEIPFVLFYKLDLSNLPVLLGTFSMGPVAGTIILAIKSAIGLLHSSTQGVGELADFIMGFAMVLPAGLIYQHSKNRKSALIGMIVGGLCATLAGILTNLYILIPFYSVAFGMPIETIVSMGGSVIPAVDTELKFVLLITGPFNLVKWAIISVVGYFIYKPLSPLLHGRKGRKAANA